MTTILDLERLEFSLVTKALVGKLKPEDAEKAKELGLKPHGSLPRRSSPEVRGVPARH